MYAYIRCVVACHSMHEGSIPSACREHNITSPVHDIKQVYVSSQHTRREQVAGTSMQTNQYFGRLRDDWWGSPLYISQIKYSVHR